VAQSDVPYDDATLTGVSSGETPTITFLQGAGKATISFYQEEPEKITFLVDAQRPVSGVVGVYRPPADSASPSIVRLQVTPTAFPFRAGRNYSINASYFDPWVQTAQTDGQLILELPQASNCTIVIEEAGENLIANGSFEEVAAPSLPAGFTVSTGQVSVSRQHRHRGNHSLRLTNRESRGTVVQYADAVPVAAGESYLAAVYYHLEGARYGSVFNFRVRIAAPGRKDIVYEPLYTSERIIYPMPIANRPGGWQRSFMNVPIPEDYKNATATVRLEMSGTPFTIYFDDLELRLNPSPANQYAHLVSEAMSQPVYSREEVYRKMQAREPARVTLPDTGRTPLRIDGQTVPLLAFASIPSPDWPNQSAHKEFFRHGIDLHFIPADAYSPNPEERTWLGKDRYDFSPIEDRLAKVLGFNPNAYVLLYIGDAAYPELGDQHPEARWVNAHGDYSVGEKEAWRAASQRKSGEQWNLSYSAQPVRQQTADYFRALGDYLKTSELGKAVVGIHIGGGTDGQWFRRGWGRGFGSFDYSAGAQRQFAAWLRRKYRNNVDSLRTLWGDETVTFETARLASEAERGVEKYYLQEDNPADRKVIDSNLFGDEGNDALCETINAYCRSFKEGIGRPALTLTYYPKKHNNLRCLINEPYLDGILGVMEYGYLRNLGQTGGNESSPASLGLHSKLFLTEMDYRTEYSSSWGEDANHHARNVVIMRTPEQLGNQMRRDLGNSLAQGQGGWFYGLSGHIWGSDDYYLVMDEAVKAVELATNEPLPDDHGQIAVFLDEKGRSYLSTWKEAALSSHYMGTYWARVPFSRSGVSWDDYLLEDVTHQNRPDYKVNVFLNSATLDAEQIKFIQDSLQRDGNVLLFFNNTGYSGGNHASTIQAVSGIQVKVDLSTELGPDTGYQGVADAPLSGLDHIRSFSSTPLFYVDDPQATPLATIQGTDRVGAAVRKFADWTGVYLSLPGVISPQFIREVVALADVTPIGPAEDVTYAGNGFIVVHAMTPGEKILRWEEESDLFDITTGRTVAHQTDRYSLTMKAFETRWFKRRPVEDSSE
jgi:hypothetical protein